jgi:hypothetical protein
MFRQQIPPFIQQISDKSSSSGLSQDTITIWQQFDSQGKAIVWSISTCPSPVWWRFAELS